MDHHELEDAYPLHFACWVNQPREVARLLLAGADPDEFDKKLRVGVHWSAWEYACSKGNDDTLRVLLAFKPPPKYFLVPNAWHPLLSLNGYQPHINYCAERDHYVACRRACVIIMALFKRRNRVIARVGCKYMARELALAVYATRATFLDAQYKSQ